MKSPSRQHRSSEVSDISRGADPADDVVIAGTGQQTRPQMPAVPTVVGVAVSHTLQHLTFHGPRLVINHLAGDRLSVGIRLSGEAIIWENC